MKVCDVQGGDRLHYFTLVPIEKRKNRGNLGDVVDWVDQVTTS